MTQNQLETCGHCHRLIGGNETPFVHGDYVLCSECYHKIAMPVETAGPAQVQFKRLNPGRIPEYFSLKLVGYVTRAFAVVALLIAGLALFLGIGGVAVGVAGRYPEDRLLASMTAAGMISTGISCLVAGLVGFALAEFILSWRDVARNSWRMASALSL